MISDNINAKAAAIFKEAQDFEAGLINTTPIADDVMDKAREAIFHGRPSDQWTTYMSLFATNQAELDRLVPNDGTTDTVREKARVYLVANAICSMGTGHNLANKVGNKLD